VGIPVSPPIAQNIEITVKCKLFEDKPVIFLAKSDQYAFFAITREKVDKKIRLTLDFAMAFKDAIIEKLARTNSRFAEMEELLKPKNFDTIMTQIATFVEGIDKWFFTDRGFANPGTDITKVRDKILSATYEANEAKVNTPFWIVIHPKKVVEQASTAGIKTTAKKENASGATIKNKVGKANRRQQKAIKIATGKR
jgi:hypothetical protein